MSDFPRGWTRSTSVNGTAGSITIPSVPNVVHVLDSFYARVFNGSASLVSPSIVLNSSDGAFSGMILGVLAAAASTEDEASVSGLDLAASPGASLTILFSSGLTAVTEFLLVQGHDI